MTHHAMPVDQRRDIFGVSQRCVRPSNLRKGNDATIDGGFFHADFAARQDVFGAQLVGIFGDTAYFGGGETGTVGSG